MNRALLTPLRPELALPPPRGPISAWVLDLLAGRPAGAPPEVWAADPIGDDAQLALYLAYELHYADLPGVAADLEWDIRLLDVRAQLEDAFECWLRHRAGIVCAHAGVDLRAIRPADVVAAVHRLLDADDGPSISRLIEVDGTREQLRDVVRCRSAYQRKEADPHTFGIPRLRGRAKQLLAEIQAGEYGADADDRVMHADLFARTMAALDLDDRPNALLAELPVAAFALSNTISLLGLHRRLRGALVGHLVAFEMTSVVPMGRYASACERLDLGEDARRFYDVHVLADAEHEVLAAEMATAFADDEPHLAGDVVLGAAIAIVTEHVVTEQLLDHWTRRASA